MVMLRPYIGGRGAIGTRAGGCAVRLAPIAETLLVGEGVFTAFSAGADVIAAIGRLRNAKMDTAAISRALGYAELEIGTARRLSTRSA